MTGHDVFRATRASRVRGFPLWPAFLAAVFILIASFLWAWGAAAQSPPESPRIVADPKPNALLASAPDHISLTFTTSIDPERVTVRLLRAGGEEVPLHATEIDGATPERLSARPTGTLDAGDYTVAWSVQPTDGGQLLTGAYPFRIGAQAPAGAAQLEGEWPASWATISRWLVFLGTALVTGGFAWTRLLAPSPGGGVPTRPIRTDAMTTGALVALLGAMLPFFLNRFLTPTSSALPLLIPALRVMPLAWWVQVVALFALALLCLAVLASGRSAARLPALLDWVGLGLGLAALVGLSFASQSLAPATLPWRGETFALEIVHQWSTALWLSGLLYLAAGWRRLGSDVARFRRVRWIGGVLLVLSIMTGLAVAWPRFSALGEFLSLRYGQVLATKSTIVLVILALGLLAMVLPRRSTALRASRSLGAQGVLAALAVLLSAVLALMARPGTVNMATLAGVELSDVVPVDRAAFAAESATISLLTQPASPGAQTLVVRLLDESGAAIALDPAPEVLVS